MSAASEPTLYPLFLKLERRGVLVVGAGAIAERKIDALLEGRALVRVVAPEATPKVQRLARDGVLEWDAREFDEADVERAWLVIAATADPAVQRRVARYLRSEQNALRQRHYHCRIRELTFGQHSRYLDLLLSVGDSR